MIDIAVCKNRKNKVYKNERIEFKSLVEKLNKTTYTNETYKEYLNLPKEEQDNIKDVGGFVGGYLIDGKRNKNSVKHRSVLTLDVDYGYKGMMDFLDLTLEYTAFMYTTHKHNEENERFRLVIPLSKTVDNLEYEAIARLVAFDIGIDYFDDSTYESSRLMYFPSTSRDAEFRSIYIEETYLDVDTYLNRYTNYKDKTSWKTSSRVSAIKTKECEKQQNPLTKDGIIGAFCKTYNIHEAIEKYLPNIYKKTTDENRYTYTGGSSYGGLIVYEDSNFAYSHHSTDPCSNKLCNSFDLVKNHLYKNMVDEKAFESMVQLSSSDKVVTKTLGEERLKIAQREFKCEEDSPSITFRSVGVDKDLEDENEGIWVTKLEVNKKGLYTPTIDNIVLILDNDKNLKNKIALNEFSHQIVVKKNLPWKEVENKKYGDNWCDSDDSNLRHYIEKVYKIKSQQSVYDGICVVASKNAFHPIKDYLNSLVWDRKYRVGKIFTNYLGAQNNKYTKAVERKILVAAVSRIFNPGIKFDNMVVFVGKQGIGKSHLIDLLGKDWYSDSINTVVGKEAYEQLQEAWIIEMAELSATKKAEIESVKHFISKREDVYRVAYGRRVEKFKRQCVFFATTNEDEFLKDKTGNRRYWPVRVNVENIKKSVFKDLTDYEIDNIWAEAVELYKNGESLILSAEENKEALKCQNYHVEVSPKEGMIKEYLNTLLPINWDKMDINARRSFIHKSDFDVIDETRVKREKVCAMEIWVELFDGDPKILNSYLSKEINDILRGIDGWKTYDKGSGKLRFGSLYGYQKAFVLDNE